MSMICRMEPFQDYFAAQTCTVNTHLDSILPTANTWPTRLHEAMRYSVLAGGKRFRPALCIATCEACGGTVEQAMTSACALELLHTYTLIHDDLPAMDDDTLRRGQPTCHIAFDEATAILAGDALLTLSFEILSGHPQGGALAFELAYAAGSRGVIGGQAEDLVKTEDLPEANRIETIHRHKTAALIRAACVMGGLCAKTSDDVLKTLTAYGEKIGLAFQITDDLLDEESTVEALGKNIGSDRIQKKKTWPTIHGTLRTKEKASTLIAEAKDELALLPGDSTILKQLADFILQRNA